MANGYKKVFRSKNFRLKLLKFLRFVPDSLMLKIEYKIKFKKSLNLRNPKTFNEKLQWLKLHNRKDVFTTMVDKYAVKDYVSNIIGEDFVIKTLGVWDRFEDINFDSLPDQFVLKCNHDSGSVIVCRDKTVFDKQKAKAVLSEGLKRNGYYAGREWPYKNVKPCILAEEFIEDGDNVCLPVYKIFCFNGEARIIQTIQNDKQPNESVDYFDRSWNLLELKQDYPNSITPFSKPEKLDEMLSLAEKLSNNESFLRVDFYIANEKLYFSEFTFFTDSGFGEFYPSNWDEIMGEWLVLPNKR
jgi:hypothetical protein